MKLTYMIYRFLYMFLSSFSVDSDLNGVVFDLIDLSHIPRSIIVNQLYCYLSINFTKKRRTKSEYPPN